MSEPRERLKLRKWLENQIDSREVPGLRWLDAEHTTFRVLWKHAGKPDFVVDKDAVLFREWARHTKRYQEGDQPDPSTWKTRFRCALNKMPDIKEVKVADSLSGSEPYRVFKFIKSDEKKTGVTPTRRSTSDPTSSYTLPVLSSHTDTRNQDIDFQRIPTTGDRSEINDWCNIEPTLPPLNLRNNCHSPLYSDDDCSLNRWENGIVKQALVTQGTNEYDSSPMEMCETSLNITSENQAKLVDFLLKKEAEQQASFSCHTQQGLHQPNAILNSPGHPSYLTELTVLQKAIEIQNGILQSHQMAQGMPDESDLMIKAFYDNKVVAENKVWFQNRLRMCRLYYGYYDAIFNVEDAEGAFNMIYGPAAAEQIPLPNKELDVPEIKSVLENMNRGLVLELSENQDIYALRLCRCKVFFSSGSQEPQKLERETKTKVFDYGGNFVPALSNSLAGFCATPSYEVTFTLGYPNGSLVMIVITHTHAKREFQIHGSKENLCSEPNADDAKAMHIQMNGSLY